MFKLFDRQQFLINSVSVVNVHFYIFRLKLIIFYYKKSFQFLFRMIRNEINIHIAVKMLCRNVARFVKYFRC